MKIMKRIYQFLLLAAGCAALTTACSDDDDSYLVRETDSILSLIHISEPTRP